METNPSEIEPLWAFVGPFNAAGIPYMITGATATILYGAPRLTNDLDVVLQLSREASRQLPGLFPATEFYLPPPDAVEVERCRPNRGHFNIIQMATGYKADVYLSGSDPLHAWGFEHRRRTLLEGGDVWLAPPEYVILRKLEYYQEGGSAKHLQDIRAILQNTVVELDATFLDRETAQRGLAGAWAAAKGGGPG